MNDRRNLRRNIRQQRAALSATQVAHASLLASAKLLELPAYRRAKRIAGYFASGGELDPLPVMLHAITTGKQCYLPRLHPFLKGRMWFLRWRPGDPLQTNRFGIPEPMFSTRARLPGWMLQLVITPLVAFDDQLNRLGMGKGYYDRSFAFRHHRSRWKCPVLCGFAHQFQRSDALAVNAWDVPMDVVVTDKQVTYAKPSTTP
jgi:5-formyltetrahydrofolate cyclo-ligase